jgi:AbiTii
VSKLSDIIDSATTDSVSVAALLRMTKVIASRMETPPLLAWVDSELGGYPARAPIPDYRGPFPAQVLSGWSGPLGSILQNVPLPPSAFPQGLRDVGAFEVEFRESVSELERLAQVDGPLSYPWSTDLVGRLNGEMQRGRLGELQQIAPLHGIVTANRLTSPARVCSVLDNVRTRVLSLALDLEKVAPDAGEPGATPADPSTVNNIVETYVYGHRNAVEGESPGPV